ncbi:MAG TPA: LysR family transcriptional regulator [Steroidobacteraceae bacterium]|jgi:DNA-binding transcriptional LysR family regulator
MRKSNLQKSTSALAWDDLRCVLAVARAGSLSGAARVLGIEHSTVFRRLNAIEKRLGVRLFARTRSGYVPTAHGEFAASAAGAMETEALAIERRMLGADARLDGVVRLATSELFAGFLLPLVLRGFLAAHPQIEVDIDVSSRAADLTRREADLALRASNAPPDHLVGRSIGELRYAVYGSQALAQQRTAATLDDLPWLGFGDSIAYIEIARWQRAHTGHNRPRVRFSSLAPMLQAAADGLGIAVLPLFAADQHPALARLGAVLEQPRMKLWVLSHREMRDNARVQALARHLTKHIPEVLKARQNLTR